LETASTKGQGGQSTPAATAIVRDCQLDDLGQGPRFTLELPTFPVLWGCHLGLANHRYFPVRIDSAALIWGYWDAGDHPQTEAA
jgi:hypothetical protein